MNPPHHAPARQSLPILPAQAGRPVGRLIRADVPSALLALLRLLAIVTLGLLGVAAQAQPLADPRVDWFSADSANFRVHHRAGQRAQAEAVARAAEAALPRVTKALQWQPRTRIEIVLYSEFDFANGFSTPLPYSFMGVFLAPPDEGQLLDNSAWFDLLLVHELTHAVHLDKVRGVPRVLQAIFGNVPWFIPNVFQPGWMTEGLAVLAESEPAAGKGRLRGPAFEAWLRAERARGFVSLREINADGRRLPVSKQYLYGAYFMEYLQRRYGPGAVGGLVERYSGNIVPRLHSAPWDVTGKTMDVLWTEFVADLERQVDERAAPLKARPETVGAPLGRPLFSVDSIATLPGGQGWLAVASDGLNGTQLQRLGRDGRRERVARVNGGARVSVAADGRVMVAQPDICHSLHLVYDLYRLEGERLHRLTRCAHLRRGVQAGDAVLALQLTDGATRLVRVAADGAVQPLHAPADGSELLDLAATADGRAVHLVSRRGGDWRVLELSLERPQDVPRTVVRRASPIQGLRGSAAGLELILAEDGVTNVWRLAGGELQRLTHAHTGVLLHAGSAPDGVLASVVVVPEGSAIVQLAQPAVLQRLPAVADTGERPAPAQTAAPAAVLQPGQPYSALRAMYPRSWLPAVTSDRGLTAFGASTSGGDALGWHRYAALLQVETSQRELVGSLEYLFLASHGIALQRNLVARAWRAGSRADEVAVFDRDTRAQWLSQFPFGNLQRRVSVGLGAAADRAERVDLLAGRTTPRRDERLLAALIDIDSSAGDWRSEGANRGWQGTLLAEGYKPLQGGDPRRYDGTVLRADLRAYLGLGPAVLALRATEARARGRTEPFQLGGATDETLQFGPVLNQRSLSLRGYAGDEAALVGTNARVLSLELRLPLADIDRHGMVPPLGINRLSGSVFVDAGGTWGAGRSGPAELSRGVGFELLAEAKLQYALPLRLRLGVAWPLDAPDGQRGAQAYLTLGRAF
ncbi:MAG: BamA/TamA family outer membrane protein [Betaproteobacteria bacterium]